MSRSRASNERPEACPACRGTVLIRSGHACGRQRWKCKGPGCGRQFTRTTPRGTQGEVKRHAIELYYLGLSMNAVAKCVGVSAQSMLRWVRDHAHAHCPKPEPARGIVAPTSPELPSQRCQCLPLASGQHGGAVERDDLEERRRHAHAHPAGSAAASMAMRQSWICAMPCASLPASSRPER